MFLNDKEEAVIGNFLKNLDKYDGDIMLLEWNEGETITARFDTCFEDENEFEENEAEYEEFTTFVFEAICISGKPPVFVTEDNFFCVNYRNFPKKIVAGKRTIN